MLTDHQDHPHACLDGHVYLGYTAIDEETGEEVERVEALPCRRCGIAGNLTPIPYAATTSEGAIIVPD